MPLTYAMCDVFTDVALAGNQVAVFTDAADVPAERMQPLAREINFSETVFVLPPSGGGDQRIRIFTPSVELPFAGHPTLGCAWVLAEERDLSAVVLETGAGPVPVALERRDGRVSLGRMDQPIPTSQPYPMAGELLAALGVASSDLPVEVYDNGPHHAFVTLSSPEEVAALKPDLRRLAALPPLTGVSCFAAQGTTCKTRMFGPWVGVPEDPATGSAAGPLAVHLVRHGRLEPGQELEISQGAEIGRPSRLLARVTGRPEAIEQVQVAGQAVVVGRGEFSL